MQRSLLRRNIRCATAAQFSGPSNMYGGRQRFHSLASRLRVGAMVVEVVMRNIRPKPPPLSQKTKTGIAITDTDKMPMVP